MLKDMKYREPDWNCPSCNYRNFYKNDKCRMCDCFRSKSKEYGGSGLSSSSSMSKPGDWKCNCGENNFAKRTICRKCNRDKSSILTDAIHNRSSSPIITTTNVRPGDWYCSTCKELNFGTRIVCHKCAKSRDENIQEKETCAICVTNKIDTCLPCGHLGFCHLCAHNLNKCPVCNKPYNPDRDIIKTYNIH